MRNWKKNYSRGYRSNPGHSKNSLRERFTSRVRLDPEGQRIDVAYQEGPFKYLNNHRLFEDHPQGCAVDFYVDFEFRSRLLQKLIEPLFSEAVRRMVAAFEGRAGRLYGGR